MSNNLIFLDMWSGHVHFYPETGFRINDRSRQKVETQNKYLSSHADQ
jgi:hypothetical protein